MEDEEKLSRDSQAGQSLLNGLAALDSRSHADANSLTLMGHPVL